MIKRILVGVSGTEAFDAKKTYTLDLARAHGATVDVVSIVDVDRLGEIGPIPIGAGHYAERMIQRRVQESHDIDNAALASFKRAGDEVGVEVNVLCHEGDPLTLLTALWRYVDLCVLGCRGWFDHGILPDPETALGRLVASGVRPVLAVPETHREVRKVIIAYNGALEAAKAMKQFALFSPFGKVETEIVCAGKPRSGESAAQVLKSARSYLESHGYPCTTRELEGDEAANVLLDHARKNGGDAIVMGGSYHRVLLARRFGRTTMKVLRNADVPLFISH